MGSRRQQIIVAMKLFYILLFSIVRIKAEEIPTLRFDDDLTWKQVFDSGFRPKYFDDNQRSACICMDQVFWFQFRNREPKIKLEKGRVKFSFPIEHEIHMLWHQGLDDITMEEGERRVAVFRNMFDGYIVQEMTMPKLIDPSGLVEAGNDENNIKARVGKYLFMYGFDNSFGTSKPIVPHFYISLSYPNKPDYMIKPLDYKIKPPAGYEWYSLVPGVDTPDPGVYPKIAPSTVIKSEPTRQRIPKELQAKLPVETPQKSESKSWPWLVGLIGMLATIIFLLKRYITKATV